MDLEPRWHVCPVIDRLFAGLLEKMWLLALLVGHIYVLFAGDLHVLIAWQMKRVTRSWKPSQKSTSVPGRVDDDAWSEYETRASFARKQSLCARPVRLLESRCVGGV